MSKPQAKIALEWRVIPIFKPLPVWCVFDTGPILGPFEVVALQVRTTNLMGDAEEGAMEELYATADLCASGTGYPDDEVTHVMVAGGNMTSANPWLLLGIEAFLTIEEAEGRRRDFEHAERVAAEVRKKGGRAPDEKTQ